MCSWQRLNWVKNNCLLEKPLRGPGLLHVLQCGLAEPPDKGMGTTEATLRMENLEAKAEWQDEDFPREEHAPEISVPPTLMLAGNT